MGVWRHVSRKKHPQARRLVGCILTEFWILQGIYPLKDEWVFGCSLKTRLADQTKNSTTEVVMVKRLNELNNQPEIG